MIISQLQYFLPFFHFFTTAGLAAAGAAGDAGAAGFAGSASFSCFSLTCRYLMAFKFFNALLTSVFNLLSYSYLI